MSNKEEDGLCISTMQALEYTKINHWDIFHIDNGQRSGNRTQRIIAGSLAKKMGVKAGVADYGYHYDGNKIGYIEMKAEKGVQQPNQKEFQVYCIEKNIPYNVCRTVDEVLNILKERKVI